MKFSVSLLALIVLIGGNAYASGFPDFALRIDVLDANGNFTGIGAVITADGLLNGHGLTGSDTVPSGTIEWGGSLFNPNTTDQDDPNFGPTTFNVVAAYTAATGTSGAELSMSVDVTNASGTAQTVIFTLQNDGYLDVPPVTASLTQAVAGVGTFAIFGDTGLSPDPNNVYVGGSGQSVTLLSQLVNTAPDLASFGSEGVYVGTANGGSGLAPLSLPGATGSVNSGALTGGTDIQNTAVPLSNSTYSIISQAVLKFGPTAQNSGSNEISFGMDTNVDTTGTFVGTAPEPSSLMLIGSSLLGLGVLRRKNQK